MFTNDYNKFFVGFDKVAEKLAGLAEQSVKTIQNYPPFNIKKIDENHYSIELAVAGFAEQDLDIEMANGNLIIKGNIKSSEKEQGQMWPSFLWKGISAKPFTRQFALADSVKVEGADLINGILKIWLETIVQEDTVGKKIPVNGGKKNATS